MQAHQAADLSARGLYGPRRHAEEGYDEDFNEEDNEEEEEYDE